MRIDHVTQDEAKSMTLDEALELCKQAERERAAKRAEMERLTLELLDFDNESLGAAVKCYIRIGQEAKPVHSLSETVYNALQNIAQIEILELEC